MLDKILSGGQTGVDRGALDAALDCHFPCGGWCPPGRLAEDGPIDSGYPLQELKRGGYPARTRQNVRDADGTLVIHFGVLKGGTRLTVKYCVEHEKPHCIVDASVLSPAAAAVVVREFIERHAVKALNVAGPRLSSSPGGAQYAYDVVKALIGAAAHGVAEAAPPAPPGRKKRK